MKAASGGPGELVGPPCVAERAEDIEEVRSMIEEGETEIATDELRYLLADCHDLLEAHLLLGQLAVGENDRPSDIELARGHFGYAFTLGEKALAAAGAGVSLPGDRPANAPWHEAARGLAWCLEKQGHSPMADRVAQTVRRADPTDPAEVTAMLDEMRSGGLPIVELG